MSLIEDQAPRLTGYVLAGGASRRFGPRDKARAEVDGVPLICDNARVLRERYGEVTVVSAPDRTYADLDLRTIFDQHPDRGPLAGIEAALLDASGDAIAVAACDLRGLDGAWYGALESALAGSNSDAAAFWDGERWQPLVAIYRRALLGEVSQRVRNGQLAVRDLLDQHGVRVKPPDNFTDLRSIDRAEDLRK